MKKCDHSPVGPEETTLTKRRTALFPGSAGHPETMKIRANGAETQKSRDFMDKFLEKTEN
jgi:hypothetical protein